MNAHHPLAALFSICALLAPAAHAAAAPADEATPPAVEQPVVPQVDRRDVQLPRFPSSDFELGLYAGAYSVQNFGTSGVGGLRLGYHVTEDFFVEATLGRTKVSDAAFRRILPGGVLTPGNETLQYTEASLGYNILPGEVFLGRNRALPVNLYVLGGIGTTHFNGQRQQTFDLGVGSRIFVHDWFALRIDLRDHMFPLDLLGQRDNTKNLELTTGLSFFF
jgi:outer membrane beta-barrel protein